MDTDLKWYIIGMIVLILVLGSPAILKEWQAGHCRAIAVEKGMGADEILRVCNLELKK